MFATGLRKVAGILGRFGKRTKKVSPKLSRNVGNLGAKAKKTAFKYERRVASPAVTQIGQQVDKLDAVKNAYNNLSPSQKRGLKYGGVGLGAYGIYKAGQRRERKKHGNRYNRDED